MCCQAQCGLPGDTCMLVNPVVACFGLEVLPAGHEIETMQRMYGANDGRASSSSISEKEDCCDLGLGNSRPGTGRRIDLRGKPPELESGRTGHVVESIRRPVELYWSVPAVLRHWRTQPGNLAQAPKFRPPSPKAGTSTSTDIILWSLTQFDLHLPTPSPTHSRPPPASTQTAQSSRDTCAHKG